MISRSCEPFHIHPLWTTYTHTLFVRQFTSLSRRTKLLRLTSLFPSSSPIPSHSPFLPHLPPSYRTLPLDFETHHLFQQRSQTRPSRTFHPSYETRSPFPRRSRVLSTTNLFKFEKTQVERFVLDFNLGWIPSRTQLGTLATFDRFVFYERNDDFLKPEFRTFPFLPLTYTSKSTRLDPSPSRSIHVRDEERHVSFVEREYD